MGASVNGECNVRALYFTEFRITHNLNCKTFINDYSIKFNDIKWLRIQVDSQYTYTHRMKRVHCLITRHCSAWRSAAFAWLCVIFMILCYIRASIQPINLLINELNESKDMPSIRRLMMNSNHSGHAFLSVSFCKWSVWWVEDAV